MKNWRFVTLPPSCHNVFIGMYAPSKTFVARNAIAYAVDGSPHTLNSTSTSPCSGTSRCLALTFSIRGLS